MRWNDFLFLRNDYVKEEFTEALNFNFSYFLNRIKEVSILNNALKSWYPFGDGFDGDSKHSFSSNDLVDTGEFYKGYKQYKLGVTSDLWVRMNLADYHEGFRYNIGNPIYFYHTFLNLGSTLYTEDKTYNNPEERNFDYRFVSLQTPDIPGANLILETFNNNVKLEKTQAIDGLNVDFIPPSGEKRLLYNKRFLNNLKKDDDISPEDSLKKIIWLMNSYTFCINKKSIFFSSDTNSNYMGPFDNHYNVSFFNLCGESLYPIAIDYSTKTTSSLNLSENQYDYWVEVNLDKTYSQSVLNWLENNAGVIIY